jgi:hypothetical protein
MNLIKIALLILLPVITLAEGKIYGIQENTSYIFAHDGSLDQSHLLDQYKGIEIYEGKHLGIDYINIISPTEITDFYFDSGISKYDFDRNLNLSIYDVFDNPLDAYLIRQKALKSSNAKKNTDLKNNSQDNDWLFGNTFRFHADIKGVTFLTGQQIQNLNSSFIGKSKTEIKLVFKEESKPYFLSGNNEIFDLSDTIYLWNDRVVGDSTYYHFYSPYNTYFLTTESGFIPEHLVAVNQSNGQERLTAEHNIHLEEDNKYSYGVNILTHATSAQEGLYKSSLQYFENKSARIYNRDYYQITAPRNSGNINSRITYSFNRTRNDVTPSEDINHLKNSQIENRSTRNGNGYYEYGYNSSNIFLNGPNIYGIGAVYIDTIPYEKNLDFLKVTFNAEPIARKGLSEFAGLSNSKYKVKGFRNPRGIAISENAGTFQQLPSSESPLQVYLSGSDNFAAVNIGDHNFYVDTNSYYIFSFDQLHSSNGDNLLLRRFSSSNSNEFLSRFNLDNSRFKLVIINRAMSAVDNLFSTTGVANSEVLFQLYDNNEKLFEEKSNRVDRVLPVSSLKSYTYEVSTSSNSEMSVVDESRIRNAFGLSKVTDIADEQGNPDYLIITQNQLLEGAREYAAYREETGYTTRTVEVQDIYDLYNHGIKHPRAIKDYIADMYFNWDTPPEYAFIIGDANYNTRLDDFRNGNIQSFVPTFGLPASDTWLSYSDTIDHIADIKLSRLSAITNDDVRGYLSKMRKYEAAPLEPWNKDLLTIYGYDKNFVERGFNQYLSIFGLAVNSLKQSQFCMDSVRIVNVSTDAVTENQGNIIRNEINKGKLWTTYFGHASAELFEIDGWQVEALNNNGRYGLFSTISCNTGAFSDANLIWSRNESYVMDSINGFIFTTGSSSTGNTRTDPIPVWNAFDVLRNSNIRTTGGLFQRSRNIPNSREDEWLEAVKYNYNVLGDPAAKIKLDVNPNYIILDESISFSNEFDSSTIYYDNDSIFINFTVYNNGVRSLDSLNITINRTWNGVTDTYTFIVENSCNIQNYSLAIPVNGNRQENRIEIIVDPERLLDISEKFESENISSSNVYIFENSILPLEPLSGWDVNSEKQQFRFVLPTNVIEDLVNYDFSVTLNDQDGNLLSDLSESIVIYDQYITAESDFNATDREEYIIYATYRNRITQASSDTLKVPFKASSSQNYTTNQVEHTLPTADIKEISTDYDLEYDNGQLFGGIDTINYRLINSIGYADNPLLVEMYGSKNEGPEQFLASAPFLEGFMFLVYDRFDPDKTPKQYAFHTFRFFDPTLTDDQNDSIRDILADNLVHFLQDTLTSDDIVFGMGARNYWEAFYVYEDESSPYYIDSLPQYFEQIGVEFPDSLILTSWAFVGSKDENMQEFTRSRFAYSDSVNLEGSILLKSPNSYLRTRQIPNIGELQSINLNIEPNDKAVDSLVIYVIGDSTSQNHYRFESLGDLNSFNWDNIDVRSAQLEMYWSDSYFENTQIGDISFNYTAMPEYILPKEYFDKDSILLRGDLLSYSAAVQNISIRNTDNASLSVSYNDLAETKAGDSILFIVNDTIVTDILPNDLNFDYQSVGYDIYNFNNSFLSSTIISEDTLKPSLYLEIDNRVAFDQMFTTSTPNIYMELYDNSAMPLEDLSNLKIRVNNKFIDTDSIEFLSNNRFVPLKGSVSFDLTEDEVFYGEYNTNYIEAWFTDGSNRSDTLDITFNISRNARTDSVIVYPNPSNENSKIGFYYTSPENSIANITIANNSGHIVRTIMDQDVSNGKNIIVWDGKNGNGTPVSNGVYYFQVEFDSRVFTDPVYGKLIRID